MPERTYITALVDEPIAEKQTQIWESGSGDEDIEIIGDGPDDQWLRFESGEVSGLLTGRSSISEYPEEDRWWGVDGPHFDFEIADVQLNIDTEERVEDLLHFVEYAYAAVNPSLMYGLPPSYTSNIYNNHFGLPVDPDEPEINAISQLNYAPWLLVISPELASAFGRDSLRATPAWRVTELDDGGIMIVAYQDPFENPETAEVTDHLDIPDAWEDLFA